jgi:hypothetical protein
MPWRDHYSSSTNPHRALMVILTIMAGGVMFSMYLGWARYLRIVGERAEWQRSGADAAKLQQEAARMGLTPEQTTGITDAAVETVPPVPNLSDLAAPKPTPKTESASLSMVSESGGPTKSILDGFQVAEQSADSASPELVKKGEELMQQFWHASSWQAKSQLVHDAPRVGDLMKTFYEQRKESEPAAGKLERAALVTIHGQPLLMLVYASAATGNAVQVALYRKGGDKLELDWESYVGWGEMTFAELKKKRPTEPTLVRGFARKGSYFNYEFDNESRYMSVQLFSPDQLTTLHTYTERDSALGLAMEEWFTRAPGVDLPLTVRIAYPEAAQSDHATRLIGIVADRWIIVK